MRVMLRRSFDPQYESRWFWGIGLLAVFIEICFHALLPISISNDTYGYLHLSQHLGNPDIAFERSIGYSLFLALLGINWLDSLVPTTLLQAALSISIPLIAFKTLRRFGLGYAVLGALIACVYFYNFIVSLYFLTEPVYVFSTAVYAFFLVRYFSNATTKNLLLVIASCWLIALIRVTGTLHFLSLLAGIGMAVLVHWVQKNPGATKHSLKQFTLATAVFLSISIFQGLISDRTSSVVWPHFAFNWVYRDASISNTYLGILKPENGPAAQKLFQEIERSVSEYPSAFDTLKESAAPPVKALKPEKDGKYSKKSVQLLMNDIMYNTAPPNRAPNIAGVLKSYNGRTPVSAMKLIGDALTEAFKLHPELMMQRMMIVLRDRIASQLLHGIGVNIVSIPTAYYHQIPAVMNTAPQESLRPGIYKQWVGDLFQHTGNDEVNREIYHPLTYPVDWEGAMKNVQSDNLVGIGHYIGILGIQVLRLCWALIVLGIIIVPVAKHKPLLTSLLCASIIPPIASVFMSETDPRHLLMCAPIHIVTAVFVVYSLALFCKRRDYALPGVAHAR